VPDLIPSLNNVGTAVIVFLNPHDTLLDVNALAHQRATFGTQAKDHLKTVRTVNESLEVWLCLALVKDTNQFVFKLAVTSNQNGTCSVARTFEIFAWNNVKHLDDVGREDSGMFFLAFPLAKKGLSDSEKSGGGFPALPPPVALEPMLAIKP